MLFILVNSKKFTVLDAFIGITRLNNQKLKAFQKYIKFKSNFGELSNLEFCS
jgi:hypothetical protein